MCYHKFWHSNFSRINFVKFLVLYYIENLIDEKCDEHIKLKSLKYRKLKDLEI